MKEGIMKYFIVDAFTDTLFKGNPAGVCMLDDVLDVATMQNIAAENNLSETAFVLKKEAHYYLRWFTPVTEIDLCGHATLGTAYVISNFYDTSADEIRFETKSGILTVTKSDDMFILDFPTSNTKECEVTKAMEQAIGCPVNEAHASRDLMLLLDKEQEVLNISPDISQIARIAEHGVIVTAKGDDVDFVSRFFAPNVGVNEDPVTGSIHTALIPFWAKRLDKKSMVSRQLSKRGGTLFCEDCGDRVKIGGKVVLYLKGEILIAS
jgi:PhzF family phenazine biosynthesis protein